MAVDEFAKIYGKYVMHIVPAVTDAKDADCEDEERQRRRFGFAWFLPELRRHRCLWQEILLASLVIQLIALATPLFTQAIIDKVVVHRTQSTLLVVIVGMSFFMLFSAALSWLRQYLVLHTGNRVNAVLGRAVLEQTLPVYTRVAGAYAKLGKEGFMGSLVATDKEREATEKARELDAQRAAVAAMDSGILAQEKRIAQLQSSYRSDLQRELANIQVRIAQLQPSLDRTNYRAGLMKLRAAQAGVIKDLATTTVGAVVQSGSVVMTLVPKDETLYADVSVKNEDVGFTHVGQKTHIKLAAYPFQRYGMLTGVVVRLGLDAADNGSNIRISIQPGVSVQAGDSAAGVAATMYRARVRLDGQQLRGPDGTMLPLAAGMKVSAEIHQGRRTVLEYLLSPVQKAVSEAAWER